MATKHKAGQSSQKPHTAATSPLGNLDQEQLDALHNRAEEFIKYFEEREGYEKGLGQTFINELCRVYDLDPKYAVSFEHQVKKRREPGTLFVDGFFPGLLLVEMKSEDKDMDTAYDQARGYVNLIPKPEDKPRYILISDFRNLHLYDTSGVKPPLKIRLTDFRRHLGDFAFIAGYEHIVQERQERASIEAAERLGELHDTIKRTGEIDGEDLQTLLVRLLFCLFADDTELFNGNAPFREIVKESNSDGDGLGDKINDIFQQLDFNPKKDRPRRTNDRFAYRLHFPYVNGALFSKEIRACQFDDKSRTALLDCCALDWSEISPDIFGNLFQHIMHREDEKAGSKSGIRRDFGAHYTSERNIRRAIGPLFLDELKEELRNAEGDKKRLEAFIKRLHLLNIFDPACGCGNFLVVSYREIRSLEMQALQALRQVRGARQSYPACDVHQFHGIEIDPTAVEIATVALWLTDHQMNRKWADGYKRIPLKNKANIVCGNALRLDWNEVISATQCSHIVGNPPFAGKQYQSAAQKVDMASIFGNAKSAGVLDYVAAWYVKALRHMRENPAIHTAFVSTNSITQGEQVGVLWQPLLDAGLYIHFAHRTFKWSNEGSGMAAVHCVIVGFGLDKPKRCSIWDYNANIEGEGKRLRAKRINPYLVDAPVLVLANRRESICKVPPIVFGSMPNDGGNLLLSHDKKDEYGISHNEYAELLANEPRAKKWIRPFLGADEFINNTPRWCLWLSGITQAELDRMPQVARRVTAVENHRLESNRATTRELSLQPHLFGEIRQPKDGLYLLIPRVSSERRPFMPIGFMDAQVIASDATLIVPGAMPYHFGVLCSTMHNAWLRAVCGRLESRYRYSAGIVYNNFPWPEKLTKTHEKTIEKAAQGVLNAREKHPDKSLAWLYNPETMPRNLKDAHDDLDEVIDDAYGYTGAHDDAERVAFLFKLYEQITADLLNQAKPPKPSRGGKTRQKVAK